LKGTSHSWLQSAQTALCFSLGPSKLLWFPKFPILYISPNVYTEKVLYFLRYKSSVHDKLWITSVDCKIEAVVYKTMSFKVE